MRLARLASRAGPDNNLSLAAAAQPYPARGIRLIVDTSPGGLTDLLARLTAEALAARVGQPVVVENKPGASGNVAADLLIRSPADGYTLMIACGGQPGGEAVPRALGAVRSAERSRGGVQRRRRRAHPGRAGEHAGEGPCAVHRLCQGQSRQGLLRVRRHRQPAAPLDRAVRARRWREAHARALQGRRQRAARHARGPPAGDVDQRSARPCPISRPDSSARSPPPRSSASPACPTCRPRRRRASRLGDERVVRRVCAEGHATRDHAAPESSACRQRSTTRSCASASSTLGAEPGGGSPESTAERLSRRPPPVGPSHPRNRNQAGVRVMKLKTRFLSHGTLGSKDLEAHAPISTRNSSGLEVVRTSPVSLMVRLGGNHVYAVVLTKNKERMPRCYHNGLDVHERRRSRRGLARCAPSRRRKWGLHDITEALRAPRHLQLSLLGRRRQRLGNPFQPEAAATPGSSSRATSRAAGISRKASATSVRMAKRKANRRSLQCAAATP